MKRPATGVADKLTGPPSPEEIADPLSRQTPKEGVSMTDISINGAAARGKKITGKELAAWLAHASVLTKLCVAAAVAARETQPQRPDHPADRADVRRQGQAAPRHHAVDARARAALTTKRRVNNVARFSNEVVDDIVDKVGANRLWAAIDRATLPKSNGGVNGNGGIHHAA